MPTERLIDVSELEPPEPFEAVLQLIGEIQDGEYVRMLHRKQPLPLIQLLKEQGFECIIQSGQQTRWEIVIWNKQDKPVNEFCYKHFCDP